MRFGEKATDPGPELSALGGRGMNWFEASEMSRRQQKRGRFSRRSAGVSLAGKFLRFTVTGDASANLQDSALSSMLSMPVVSAVEAQHRDHPMQVTQKIRGKAEIGCRFCPPTSRVAAAVER